MLQGRMFQALALLLLFAVQESSQEVADRCPDGTFCQATSTCCQLATGKYGCCPHPHAVCCPDKVHCCPQNYKCDTEAKRCVKGIMVIEATFMMPSETKEVADEMSQLLTETATDPCPAGTCPRTMTCCTLKSGQPGCCPYNNAVCCPDKEHCCPHGTHCDSTSTQCLKEDLVIDAALTLPSTNEIFIQERVMDPCPAGTCPQTMTCCTLKSGQPGCCPYPNAVCCPDKEHCCPHGSHCDSTSTHCLKGDTVFDAALTLSTTQLDQFKDPCPAGTCPETETCCTLKSGQPGCCPYRNAVCCPDKEHCCPEATHCDSTSTHCLKGDTVLDAVLSLPATQLGKVMDPCPAGTCPQTMTCCTLKSGQPGCCPYANAVCCPDKEHCCPHGTHCDSTSTHCLKGDTVIDSSLTISIKAEEKENNYIIGTNDKGFKPCPTGGSCPDTMTCCPLQSGGSGCCPYPDAVCCKDKVHCCPHGTQCDVTSTKCLTGNSFIYSTLKIPSKDLHNIFN